MVSRQRRDQLKYPHKHKARKIASRAIEQGILVRPEICPGCGEKKFVESHHEDYNKPLEVLWRCRQCHIKLHLKPPFTCRICGDITASSSTSKGTASRKLQLCPKHYKKLRRYGDPEWKKPVLQCPHGHPVPSYCYKCKIARRR